MFKLLKCWQVSLDTMTKDAGVMAKQTWAQGKVVASARQGSVLLDRTKAWQGWASVLA